MIDEPIDKLLHVVAAVVFVGSVALGGVWGAAIVNSILWPLREAVQRGDAGKPMWWGWSLDNHLEAWPPVLTGFAIAWIGG